MQVSIRPASDRKVHIGDSPRRRSYRIQTIPESTPSPAAADTRAMQANRQGTTTAIVGAGFSGISVAIQLLRQHGAGPSRVVLVEPRAELGAGVAYATRDYPYPLNVAAGQMSLESRSPDDFLEFANAQGIDASAGDFLPRQVYGDYLRARLDAAREGIVPREGPTSPPRSPARTPRVGLRPYPSCVITRWRWPSGWRPRQRHRSGRAEVQTRGSN
jgi:hypothetical protein